MSKVNILSFIIGVILFLWKINFHITFISIWVSLIFGIIFMVLFGFGYELYSWIKYEFEKKS